MNDQAWASAVVRRCVESGIDHFFLAPGSRCTPLTLAIARNKKASVVQHFDERGLAFAVLGFGKSSERPGVFVCTSGTAVANAYPAVIEAATEGVPMLLFTADRPDELRGTGANQTIEQRNIFRDYPRRFLHMPAPEDLSADPTRQNQLHQSLEHCLRESKLGPVHVNWTFREPFTIEDGDRPEPTSLNWVSDSVEELSDSCSVKVTGNTLIVIGNCTPQEAREAIRLAKRLACPMLSDVTSGLRTGSLELPTEFSLPRPDTVLHLGGRVVSKSWLAWCASVQASGSSFIHLTPNGHTFNPNRMPQQKVHTALSDLDSKITGPVASNDFVYHWKSAAEARDDVIRRQLSATKSLTEPALAFFLYHTCPESRGLFIGNSMPIRDMDGYGISDKLEVRFVDANRGASGIDGLVATGTGYAIGLQKPTTVVLGDLSALHDLNSLSLVAQAPIPIVVVIINNQGGHIFDQLPIRQSQQFEQYFATPHKLHFEHAAKMFGMDYDRIDEMEDFKVQYRQAVSAGKTIVLEVMTDRQRNIKTRQQLQKEIQRCSRS